MVEITNGLPIGMTGFSKWQIGSCHFQSEELRGEMVPCEPFSDALNTQTHLHYLLKSMFQGLCSVNMLIHGAVCTFSHLLSFIEPFTDCPINMVPESTHQQCVVLSQSIMFIKVTSIHLLSPIFYTLLIFCRFLPCSSFQHLNIPLFCMHSLRCGFYAFK